MIGRVVLASILALSACKKNESTGETPTGSSSTGSSSTGSSVGSTKPTGDKRVSDANWTAQTGPGFTVQAPGPATHEKVPRDGTDRAFDRYTFYTSERESYVVEVTALSADDDVGMVVGEMRMRITARTQAVRNEDWIEGDDIKGRDLRYVHDQGDDTLGARSKIIGKGTTIFHVRGIAPEDDPRSALADKFIDSFAMTP